MTAGNGHHPGPPGAQPGRLQVGAMLEAGTRQPVVVIVMGDITGYLTPEEAITHGIALVQAATRARYDATAYEVLIEVASVSHDTAARFLGEVEHRMAPGGKDGG